MTADRIASFWQWFADHALALRPAYIDDRHVAALEDRLFAITDGASVGWEIGPVGDDGAFFAVSLTGHEAVSRTLRALIDAAPSIDRWELRLGKPPRDWQLAFELVLDDGTRREVDGTRWEVVLRRHIATGKLDVLLRPDESVRDLAADLLDHAAEVIVEGELGQQRRVERIRDVFVVTAWTDAEAKAARTLEPGMLAKRVG